MIYTRGHMPRLNKTRTTHRPRDDSNGRCRSGSMIFKDYIVYNAINISCRTRVWSVMIYVLHCTLKNRNRSLELMQRLDHRRWKCNPSGNGSPIRSIINIQYIALHWRHNDHDCVSNHQPYDCLLNRLFRRKSKKTSKLRVAGLCVGNSPGPVNSPHKGPVTRKMFPFWWRHHGPLLNHNKTHISWDVLDIINFVTALFKFYKNALAPNRRLAISNHHGELCGVTLIMTLHT